MQKITVVLALAAGLLALGAGCKDNGGQPDAGVEAGIEDDLSTVEGPVTKKNDGESCSADTECLSSICYAEKCRKLCAGASSCASGEDCGSDDGKRAAFCYAAAYSTDIGKGCAVTGSCPTGMKCWGNADVAAAYCTGQCKDDTACPPTFSCREFDENTGKVKYCVRRGFCARCQHDGQCVKDGKCVKQGTESFCTRPCRQGGTECPRFADCKDVGAGNFQCVHKAGTCAGNGGMCQPCTDEPDCETGALCLTFTFSHEAFCATSCPTAKATCADSAEYTCEEIPLSDTEKTKQCVPNDDKNPSCVKPLSPNMEVGDTMEDFAMVGYADSNDDYDLRGETLKVVKLSDFEDGKIILFNVSAGWCGPCQQETTQFGLLMENYRINGLRIFQVLYDGLKQGERPTKAFLDKWVNGATSSGVALNPQGACGIDPQRLVSPLNTSGTTPLNMILDAKTRKVLAKYNAIAPSGYTLDSFIRKQLGLPPAP